MQRWHTLAAYYNQRYGSRVQKIPLDAGASCPNRDGTLSFSGCMFCNANGSGSGRAKQGDSLLQQWNYWRSIYLRDDPNTRFTLLHICNPSPTRMGHQNACNNCSKPFGNCPAVLE